MTKKLIVTILMIFMITTLMGWTQSQGQGSLTDSASSNVSQSLSKSTPKSSETGEEQGNSDKSNPYAVPSEPSNPEVKELTQEEKAFYVKEYIAMSPFTFQSWTEPETIESF